MLSNNVGWYNIDRVYISAALKSCVGSTGAKNGVIQFTDVKTADGIHNTDLIRTSGIFTSENPGLYLISVYIRTYTINSYYDVYKNTVKIAKGYSSSFKIYETVSVTVIEHLTVNDTISATGGMYAYRGYMSCLTILQIQ